MLARHTLATNPSSSSSSLRCISLAAASDFCELILLRTSLNASRRARGPIDLLCKLEDLGLIVTNPIFLGDFALVSSSVIVFE